MRLKEYGVWIVAMLLIGVVVWAADDGTIARTVDIPTLAAVQTNLATVPTAASSAATTKISFLGVGSGSNPMGAMYLSNKDGFLQHIGEGGSTERCSVGGGLSASLSATASASVTPAPATTNYITQLPQYITVSATGVGNSATYRQNATYGFWRGNAAGFGGFLAKFKWGVTTSISVQRVFIGMYGTINTIGNVEPSSLADTIYFGCDAATTNYGICANGGSGTSTCTDLGSNFPCKTANVAFTGWIYVPPNGSTAEYAIQRHDVANFASGVVPNDLPTATTFLGFQMTINAASSSGTVTLAPIQACIYTQ